MSVISAASEKASAGGKVAVFSRLKRGSKVFTLPVENTQSNALVPIIAWKVQLDSVVYTDAYKAYDTLDITDFHHMRINHSKLFAEKQNHINGIENFWNQATKTPAKIQRYTEEKLPSVFERM